MRPNKTQQLYHELKKELIALSPGDSFLSTRTIMNRYGVSQATVTAVTNRLFTEGLLEKHAGREGRITEKVLAYRPGAKPTLCLALPRWTSTWYTQVEKVFFALEKELGYELCVSLYSWEDGLPSSLPHQKIDALVIVPSCSELTAEHLIRLDQFGIPVSVLGGKFTGVPVNSVNSDNEYCGAMGANYLIELGHRSLAVVKSEPSGETIDSRLKGFVQMCELRQIEYSIIDCSIVRGDNIMEKVYRRFQQLLDGPRPAFTGVLTLSEASTPSILKAMYERHYRVPDDFSLITVGEWEMLDYFYPSITRIGSSVEDLVRATVKQVLGKDALTRPTETILLKQQLMVRGSTAAPPCGHSSV